MTTRGHQFQAGDIVKPAGLDHRYKVISTSRSWVWIGDAVEIAKGDDNGRDGPIAIQARDVELVQPATQR